MLKYLLPVLLFYLFFLWSVSFSSLSLEPYPPAAPTHVSFPGENYFKGDGRAWGALPFLAVKIIKQTQNGFIRNIYRGITALFFAIIPLLFYVAALNFGLSPQEAICAALLATLYWLFDPVLHNCWFWGQAAWPSASALAV
ncbi:MAG: hypothetical protein ACE5GM_07805, partial [bacterium]